MAWSSCLHAQPSHAQQTLFSWLPQSYPIDESGGDIDVDEGEWYESMTTCKTI